MPRLKSLKLEHIQKLFPAKILRQVPKNLPKPTDPIHYGQYLRGYVNNYAVELTLDDDGLHGACNCPNCSSSQPLCTPTAILLQNWVENPEQFKHLDRPPPVTTKSVAPPKPRPDTDAVEWLTEPLTERAQAVKGQFDERLEALRVADLRDMARLRQVKIKGTRKVDLLAQLREVILDPASLQNGYDRLDSEYQLVLKLCAILSGFNNITTAQMDQMLTVWPPSTIHKALKAYWQRLIDYGYLLSPNTYAPPQMSPLVQMRLAPLWGDEVSPQPDEPQGEVRLADPFLLTRIALPMTIFLEREKMALRAKQRLVFLGAIFRYQFDDWRFDVDELQQLHLQLLKQADPPTWVTVPAPKNPLADTTIASFQPLVDDPAVLAFVYRLLTTAGVLMPGSPLTLSEAGKPSFTALSEAEQWAVFVRAFLKQEDWSVIWSVVEQSPTLRIKRVWPNRHGSHYSYSKETLSALEQDWAWAQRLLLYLLAHLPQGEWLAVSDICQLARKIWGTANSTMWRTSGYHRPQGDKLWWQVMEDDQALDTAQDEQAWLKVQGAFIEALLSGPLHWLGVADLALDPQTNRLTAVRLHRLDELLFNVGETPEPPTRTTVDAPASGVTFSADGLQISVDTRQFSGPIEQLLEQMAQLTDVAVDKLTYKIDLPCIHGTFEKGLTLAQLEQMWSDAMSVEIPPALHKQLKTWWHSYGRTRIYQNVTLLEFVDAYARREMEVMTSLTQHIVADISDQAVIIPVDSVDLLLAELEKAGHTPKVKKP